MFTKVREDAKLPYRATAGAAGWDLFAAETIVIGQRVCAVPTGVSVKLPSGTYGRIAIRSGMALRRCLVATAGVIDSDYTGEIAVLAFCSYETCVIEKGERFAQLIVEKIHMPETTDATMAPRNDGGYGSTGLN